MSVQIVEEVPRLNYGSCENLRKFQKVYKRKGIQNCSHNFEFKYFPNYANSKPEVVRYIDLLLQASTYIILASHGQRNQMPHYLVII